MIQTLRTSFSSNQSACFFLGGIIWLANFIHAGSFGIYEDDYIMVLPAIGRSFSELLSANWGYLFSWPQGRPIFWILTDTWIWLVYKLGGINGLYLGAVLLQWICSFFVLKLLLRLLPFVPAFLGAVFFVLFPPDAGKQIIMHQAVFPFTTLCMIGFFALFQKRKYLLASLALLAIGLNYEPYLLVSLGCGFLLLAHTPNKSICKTLLAPFLMTVGVLMAVLVLRQVIGESRAVEVLGDPLGPILRGLASLFIGPFYLVVITLGRSTQALLYASWDERMAWAVTAGLVIFLLRSLELGDKEKSPNTENTNRRWLLAAGVVMMVAPYFYRFHADYYPPTLNIGRLSSLHQVSALGASLLLALLIDFSLKSAQRNRTWILAGWAIWITAFVPLGLRIQTSQYVKSATLQREFWLELASQIGDWKPGFPILVDYDSGESDGREWRPATEGFRALWLTNYPNRCLADFFVLPSGWPTRWPDSPGVYAYDQGMSQWLVPGGLAMTSSYTHSRENPLVIRPGRFLYFRWEKGRLVRSNQPIQVLDQEFAPLKNEGGQNWLEPVYTRLGADLFERPRGMWRGFPKAKHYP